MGKLFCLFIYQDKIKNMEDKFFKSFSGWTSSFAHWQILCFQWYEMGFNPLFQEVFNH